MEAEGRSREILAREVAATPARSGRLGQGLFAGPVPERESGSKQGPRAGGILNADGEIAACRAPRFGVGAGSRPAKSPRVWGSRMSTAKRF